MLRRGILCALGALLLGLPAAGSGAGEPVGHGSLHPAGQTPASSRMLVLADSGTSRALLREGGGLFLEREGFALLGLGDGFGARFDGAGRLFFERRVDFTERLFVEETWLLEPGSEQPVRLDPALRSSAPPVPLPPPLPAAGSGPVRICIDPGHGGSDPGAVAQGFEEAPFALDIALRLRDLLLADALDDLGGGDWEVLMTRVDDSTVSLGTRVALANAWPAERFLSIHLNGFSNPAANGTETYSFAEGTTGAGLRDLVQEELLAAWGLADRGTKTANFFVLSNTTMPAVLSESGFLSSPLDILFIADPDQRQRAAEAHLFALQRHLGFAPYLPGQNPAVYCTPKQNSLGCSPRIGWEGTPTLGGADDFVLTASAMLPGQFGVLFWGHAPLELPFGGGLLCVSPPLTRTQVQQASGQQGSPLCDGSYAFDFDQAYLVSSGLLPGSIVHAQWWARDPGFSGAEAIGLTAGVRFLIEP